MMKMRSNMVFSVGMIVLGMATSSTSAAAQDAAADGQARLSRVLPADVARHVLAVVGDARSDNLPADALVNRSLKFAARGIAPREIERAAVDQLDRMRSARDVLRSARRTAPGTDEIEAGAEALREGTSGPDISKLARSTPSGRSLAVPLYVLGSLVSRGIPSGEALLRVQSKLSAHASDAEIEAVDDEGVGHEAVGHGTNGSEVAASHRPADAGHGEGARQAHGGGAVGGATHGPPAGVPGNAGAHGRPSTAGTGHGPPHGKGHP